MGLVVAGLVAAVVVMVRAWNAAEQASFDTSLAGPGEEQPLTIVKPGGYTIAYIGPVIAFNEQDQRELAQDLDISVVPAEGGDPLSLQPYDGFYEIKQDGSQWVPLHTVHFDRAGEFVLRSSAFAGVDEERSVLAVSESPFRKLRDGVVMASIILVVALLLAILLTVILAVTRRRARTARRRLPPDPPTGWPGPSSGPPGYPVPTGYPPPTGYPGPTGYPVPTGYPGASGYPAPTGYPDPASHPGRA